MSGVTRLALRGARSLFFIHSLTLCASYSIRVKTTSKFFLYSFSFCVTFFQIKTFPLCDVTHYVILIFDFICKGFSLFPRLYLKFPEVFSHFMWSLLKNQGGWGSLLDHCLYSTLILYAWCTVSEVPFLFVKSLGEVDYSISYHFEDTFLTFGEVTSLSMKSTHCKCGSLKGPSLREVPSLYC